MNQSEIMKIMINYYKNNRFELHDRIVNDYIRIYTNDSSNSSERFCALIWNDISESISNYDPYQLYILSECMREQYNYRMHPPSHDFKMTEINEMGILLQIQLENVKSYKYNDIDNRIFEILEKIKIYNIARINSFLNKTINSNYEMKDLLKPNNENEKELNQFLDTCYIQQGYVKKLEDSSLSDEITRQYLKDEELNPRFIRKELINSMDMELGFSYADFENVLKRVKEFVSISENRTKYNHREWRIRDIYSKLNCSISFIKFSNIVHYFSTCNYPSNLIKPRQMELKCFKKWANTEKINFGLLTVLQTFSIFNNILLSGHFREELGLGSVGKPFDISQNKLSHYFSYYIADILHNKGLDIPRKQSGVFNVEIMKIKNISFNDIDVIACNHDKKIIYNIELKVFKPPMNYRKMVMSTIKNNHKENILRREKLIEDNILTVGQELYHKNLSNYTIESVIIMSRPIIDKLKHDKNIKKITLSELIGENSKLDL